MTVLRVGLILTLLYIHSGWALKVTSVTSSPPYLTEVGKGEYEGYIKDLLDALEIEYEFVIPEDGKYGKKDETSGTWSGMIGMITNNKAQLIAADLTMTDQRAEVVDFTVPFMDNKLVVMVKAGGVRGLADNLSLVFAPFTLQLWILVLIAYLLTSVTFWVVSRVNPAERGQCLGDSMWHIASAFVYASRPAPSACSKRIVLLGWWIFAIIIFVAYAVTLYPFLVSGKASFRYENVDAMLANSDFRFACFRDGSTHNLLKASNDDVHKEIFARISQAPEESLFDSNKEAIKKLEASEGGTFGVIMEGGAADYWLNSNCDYYSVGNLATRYYAIAGPKESPQIKELSKKILEKNENGELQSLMTKWWPSRDCSNAALVGGSIEDTLALDIPQIIGAVLLLLIFLAVGFATAFFELADAIKKDPEQGPLAKGIKNAFCGCLPGKSSECPKDEEAPASEEEKLNGGGQ